MITDFLNYQPYLFIGISLRMAHLILMFAVGVLFRQMYNQQKKEK